MVKYSLFVMAMDVSNFRLDALSTWDEKLLYLKLSSVRLSWLPVCSDEHQGFCVPGSLSSEKFIPALTIDEATGTRAGERCDFDGDFRLRSGACFFIVELEGLPA